MTAERSAEAWDSDLGPEMLRRLSPADKGRRVSAALTRKVSILERWVIEGPPKDEVTEVPGNRAKLRRWRSPREGLWAWLDPAVDDPKGRNKDLMARFTAALASIERQRRRKGRDLRNELDAALLRIAALESQNLRLIDENGRLKVELSSKRTDRT